MKKFLVTLALLPLISGTAHALPTPNADGDGMEDVNGIAYAYYQNSGGLMAVYDGNNEGQIYNDGTLEARVETWLGVNPDTFTLTETVMDYEFNTQQDGTWSTSSPGTIGFYAVKAGNYYAMYYLDPAEATGSWSTYDIWLERGGSSDSIELSHFTGYNQAAPVPEPATFLLFGTGLLGFIGVSRKRLK